MNKLVTTPIDTSVTCCLQKTVIKRGEGFVKIPVLGPGQRTDASLGRRRAFRHLHELSSEVPVRVPLDVKFGSRQT